MEQNTQITTTDSLDTLVEETTGEIYTTEEHHEGPHIPLIQGEQVWGPITNVSITTMVFLVIVVIVSFFANSALKKNKKSKLKLFFLTFVKFFDDQMRDAF